MRLLLVLKGVNAPGSELCSDSIRRVQQRRQQQQRRDAPVAPTRRAM